VVFWLPVRAGAHGDGLGDVVCGVQAQWVALANPLRAGFHRSA
jgi:hypothetical protein